jgi:hypothetical protein
MRRVVWLSGLFVALSCSVDNSNLNVDAGGSGGAGGCPRCVGTGGASGGQSGGATGSGGSTNGTGGVTAGTGGEAGSVTGTGGAGSGGNVTGTGGSATGSGGSATAGATGAGGSVTGTGGAGGGGNATGAGGSATGGRKGSGGDGAQGGTPGTGGGKGQGGQGGAASCDTLATDYSNALTAAKKCTPGATNQCQQLVDNSISCPGCKTYVNDVTTLDTIQTEWTAAGCGSATHLCPQIACVVPVQSTCTSTSANPGGPNAGADPSGTCSGGALIPVAQ